jgi:phage shock protein C
MDNQMKRFYRSRGNKIWAGIIGGVGEYFDIDPSLLRLAYILLTFLTGFLPGFFAYIVAMLIIPQAQKEKK